MITRRQVLKAILTTPLAAGMPLEFLPAKQKGGNIIEIVDLPPAEQIPVAAAKVFYELPTGRTVIDRFRRELPEVLERWIYTDIAHQANHTLEDGRQIIGIGGLPANCRVHRVHLCASMPGFVPPPYWGKTSIRFVPAASIN